MLPIEGLTISGRDLRALVARARHLLRALGSDYHLDLFYDATMEPIADGDLVSRFAVVQYRRRKILR